MNGAFRYEPLPVFGERLENILSWWRRCRRVGAGGFLITSWEANRLALELTTAVDAAAACLWLNPGVEDPREMLRGDLNACSGRVKVPRRRGRRRPPTPVLFPATIAGRSTTGGTSAPGGTVPRLTSGRRRCLPDWAARRWRRRWRRASPSAVTSRSGMFSCGAARRPFFSFAGRSSVAQCCSRRLAVARVSRPVIHHAWTEGHASQRGLKNALLSTNSGTKPRSSPPRFAPAAPPPGRCGIVHAIRRNEGPTNSCWHVTRSVCAGGSNGWERLRVTWTSFGAPRRSAGPGSCSSPFIILRRPCKRWWSNNGSPTVTWVNPVRFAHDRIPRLCRAPADEDQA